MYLVIEIQTDANDTVSTLVTQHTTLNEAESKYHTVLAAAAISSVPYHAAVLMQNFGNVLMSHYYSHVELPEVPEE